MYYTDVEFRMILLLLLVWHDCTPYGPVIYATIVIINGVMELHSILHEITIVYHLLSFRDSGISYGIVI